MYSKILMLLLICQISFSQKEYSKQNSTLTKANSQIDSLNKELLFYRLKEDYFTEALSEQATRFSLIIGSIIGLVALVSLAGFRNEVKKIQTEFVSRSEHLNNELNSFINKTYIHEKKLNISSGNFFVLAGDTLITQNKVFAMSCYLSAAKFFSLNTKEPLSKIVVESFSDKDKDEVKFVTNNLRSANDLLKEIIKEPDFNEELKESLTQIIRELNYLKTLQDNDTQDLYSEFRYTLMNYLKSNN